MLEAVTITRLEKAATDNGFDLAIEHTEDWLSFGSSQTSMRIWLTARDEAQFLAAASRADVLDGLSGFGKATANPFPGGAAGVRSVADIAALHRLLRRAFQLSRTLPDALLHLFEEETADLPRTTEVERLVVQRVGQDIFRRGLLEYWDGRCAITGLDVPELLRASHIKPWADCDSDNERLDIFNGLLLAAHLDSAFDSGYVTIADDGSVLVSDALPEDAWPVVGAWLVEARQSGVENLAPVLTWLFTPLFAEVLLAFLVTMVVDGPRHRVGTGAADQLRPAPGCRPPVTALCGVGQGSTGPAGPVRRAAVAARRLRSGGRRRGAVRHCRPDLGVRRESRTSWPRWARIWSCRSTCPGPSGCAGASSPAGDRFRARALADGLSACVCGVGCFLRSGFSAVVRLQVRLHASRCYARCTHQQRVPGGRE